MPTTTTHGFRKPLGGEPANGPGDIGNLADDVETYATSNDAALAPALAAWTSYTPTWTGGSPTIGNGTLVGSYRTVGKTVQYRIELTAGSTTNYGSGTWLFTLPVAPTAPTESVVGSGMAYDTSGSARTTLIVRHSSTPGTVSFVRGDTGAQVTNAAPYAWATGDRVSVTGFYEVA